MTRFDRVIQVDSPSRGLDTLTDSQTHAVIGAAMEVHHHLGSGFLEAVYCEALAVEFELRRIGFGREVAVPVYYKGQLLGSSYRADFICHEDVIVKAKAIKALGAAEEAQILNYLKATRIERGLLLDFGRPRLELKRYVFSNELKGAQADQPRIDARGDEPQIDADERR